MKKIWLKIKTNWIKIYFVVSIILIIFIYGVIIGQFRVFPFKHILQAEKAAVDLVENFKHYTHIKPEKFLRPIRYEGEGIAINKKDPSDTDLTFIVSMWQDQSGMQLINMSGVVLHSWQVSFNKAFPEADHIKEKITDWDVEPHGAILCSNGDVIFNFEYKGLVKIDQDSNIIWQLPLLTHHSVYQDQDGNLWVPGKEVSRKQNKKFPLLRPPIAEEYIYQISSNGKLIKKISILDIIYNSNEQAMLSADSKDSPYKDSIDLMHLNDIELLPQSIADQFPMFETGDIMISLRNVNLIAIIDPRTERIKWQQIGPFVRAHDPDFLPNGQISIFNNNRDNTSDGSIMGGSKIIGIRPGTKEIYQYFTETEESKFFTNILGDHQHLASGNILIVESEGGRIIEVNAEGKVVWSYINRYDQDEVYVIYNAYRVPVDYVNFN